MSCTGYIEFAVSYINLTHPACLLGYDNAKRPQDVYKHDPFFSESHNFKIFSWTQKKFKLDIKLLSHTSTNPVKFEE